MTLQVVDGSTEPRKLFAKVIQYDCRRCQTKHVELDEWLRVDDDLTQLKHPLFKIVSGSLFSSLASTLLCTVFRGQPPCASSSQVTCTCSSSLFSMYILVIGFWYTSKFREVLLNLPEFLQFFTKLDFFHPLGKYTIKKFQRAMD